MPGDSQQPIGMTPTARHTVAGSINAVTAGASAEDDHETGSDRPRLSTNETGLGTQRFGERYATPTFSCMSTFARKYPRRKPGRNLTLPTSTTGGSVEKTRSGASRAMTFTTPSVMKGAGHQCLTNSRGPSYHPLLGFTRLRKWRTVSAATGTRGGQDAGEQVVPHDATRRTCSRHTCWCARALDDHHRPETTGMRPRMRLGAAWRDHCWCSTPESARTCAGSRGRCSGRRRGPARTRTGSC